MTSKATMDHMIKIANSEPFVKISVNLKFTANTDWFDYTCSRSQIFLIFLIVNPFNYVFNYV